jgi:methyl-accepting chemotaxis protein WspA
MTIKKRFFLTGAVFFIFLSVVGLWIASEFIYRVMLSDLRGQTEMLLYSMKAVRAHTGNVIRPIANELIGETDFITELQSTSFTANGVFSQMSPKYLNGLTFRTASIKPRNPLNKATPFETTMIHQLDDMFIEGREPIYEGIKKIGGHDYYVVALGEVTRAGCLQCHGRPEDAPPGLRQRYPVESDESYSQQLNRIVSAEIVTMPLTSISKEVKRAWAGVAGLAVVGLVIGLLVLHFGLNVITKPIVRMKNVAGLIASGNIKEAGLIISRPAESDRARVRKRHTEIDELNQSFERMTGNLDNLIGRVQEAEMEVTTTASEIAASARQMEATVAQQAASANEVAATSKAISQRSKELAGSIDEVTTVADGTADLAVEGQSELEAMEEAMVRIVDSSSVISNRLSDINEKTGDISEIVAAITKVAEQTNLLSLNASIEAEKAGEAGLGFSVVAREIRRLADQTAVSATNIGHRVKEMRSAVSSGVMEMDKFMQQVRVSVDDMKKIGGHLTHIIEQVQDLRPRFETVKDAARDQSAGAHDISEAMIQLYESVEQSKNSLIDFNKATTQLSEAARTLHEEVSGFSVEG